MGVAFGSKLRSLGFSSYEDYLASDIWRRKREEYRRSHQPQCCLVCRSKKFILHHLNYERLGAERLTDFMPLCDPHHYRLHQLMKKHGWKGSRKKALKLLNSEQLAAESLFAHEPSKKLQIMLMDISLLSLDDFYFLRKWTDKMIERRKDELRRQQEEIRAMPQRFEFQDVPPSAASEKIRDLVRKLNSQKAAS